MKFTASEILKMNQDITNNKKNIIPVAIISLGLFVICCLRHGDLRTYMFAGIAILLVSLMNCHGKMQISRSVFRRWAVTFWLFAVLMHIVYIQYDMGWRSILIYLLPGFSLCVYISQIYDGNRLWSILKKAVIIADTMVIIYVLLVDFRSFLSGSILRLGFNASGNVNTVAMYLCFFAAIIYFLIVFEYNKRIIPLFVLTLSVILLTGSKKGLVGIGIFLLVISFSKYGFKIWKYTLILIAVVIGVYLVRNNALFYQALGRRLDAFWYSLGTAQENGSTGERIGMYQLGWEYFLRSPLWGNGYGYFSSNSVYGTYSHSCYVEILVSFGLIGLVLFYSYHLRLLKYAVLNRKYDSICILFITLIFMQLFFDSSSVGFYNNALMYFILFVGSKLLLYNDKWIVPTNSSSLENHRGA